LIDPSEILIQTIGLKESKMADLMKTNVVQ